MGSFGKMALIHRFRRFAQIIFDYEKHEFQTQKIQMPYEFATRCILDAEGLVFNPEIT